MAQTGYWVIVAAEIALLIVTLRLISRGRPHRVYEGWVIVALLIALIYDNTMLALGSTIGEGGLLEALSVPRFVTHVVLTPMLLVFAALSADRMNVPGYRNRRTLWIWTGVGAVALVVGLFIDVINLHLVPKVDDGILRYTHAEPVPPIAIVIIIVGLMVIGVQMWRAVGWPWLFAGSIAMFVIAALFPGTGVITNSGECLLIASMVATARQALACVEREHAAEPAAAS